VAASCDDPRIIWLPVWFVVIICFLQGIFLIKYDDDDDDDDDVLHDSQ